MAAKDIVRAERAGGMLVSELDRFAAIGERLAPGARLRSIQPLAGGVSALVHALVLEAPGGHRWHVVVRQQGSPHGERQLDRAATVEFELLGALHRAGLPVPEPLLLDSSCALLPKPFVVMRFVPGSVDAGPERLDDRLQVMAEMLLRIHAVSPAGLLPLPERLDPLPELLEFLPDDSSWRRLRDRLEEIGDSAFRGRPVLLHGDFWAGNLLWQDARLAAVLDWEDAAVGDPHSDVAGSRLELFWQYGPDAPERFLQAYAAGWPLDFGRLTLWELSVSSAALRYMGGWGLEPGRLARMRAGGRAFLDAAAARFLGDDVSG